MDKKAEVALISDSAALITGNNLASLSSVKISFNLAIFTILTCKYLGSLGS